MQLRWKDLEADTGHWLGLAVEASQPDDAPRSPACRLETGANGRIRLMQGQTPLLWATLCHDYAGVHLLRTQARAPHPVPADAIASATIEAHKALAEKDRLPAWSRLFAQALARSEDAFLYPGLWLFAGVRPQRQTWQFTSEPLPRCGSRWPIHEVHKALQDDSVGYLDWWFTGSNELVSLRPSAPHDDSRLKWWRKKAREQALPPILVWHVGCLDAYVIVDGHVRLQAALLENQPPDFIVATSAQQQPWPADEKKQQAVVRSLERAHEQPRFKGLPTGQMNALLTAAFDDRPVLRPRTHAWARIASDAQWVAEVEAQLRAVGRLDALGAFVDRG